LDSKHCQQMLKKETPRNILVTGSTGFVGQVLVHRLEQRGDIVHNFARSIGNDILDKGVFRPFMEKGIVAVFHLAGLTFVPDSWGNSAEFYSVNCLGTQHALEFCRAVGAHMIYISAYVYGVPQYLPIDERHPVVPNNPYSHSKWLGEELCRFYANNMGVKATVLRGFNLYGPGQDNRFLLPWIIMQAKEGKKIVVKDDTPRRDYIHVDDFVGACILAMQTSDQFRIFNVGSGYSLSVREIIEAVIRTAGNSVGWSCTGEVRPNEITDTVADCRVIYRDLGWRASKTLAESLPDMMK
jgi:nucleoside-diphosphate-sugar epimerase